jgi:uncharacterized membrane protein (UPF0127 family)
MGTNERKKRRFIRQSLSILIGLGLLLAVLLYARNLEQQQTYFFAKFKTPTTVTSEFKLEIANDDAERAKGLMYRKELAEGQGMVFVFPNELVRTFWMKNTYIPLDMIFIDSSWKIIGILEDVPVLNSEQRSVPIPSQYIIELPAGSVKKHSIVVGADVIFSGVAPKAEG